VEQANKQTVKGRRKALFAAVAVIAVAAVGVVGVKTVYEGKVKDFIASTGGTAEVVKVDFLGRIHVRNFVLPQADGGNLRIAAADGRQEFLFLKSDLEVNGVEVETQLVNASIPHIRWEEPAFNKNIPHDASPADVIASFSAKRIFIPETIATQKVANTGQKTVYKDVVFTGVADGKIAQYSVDSSSYDVTVDVPESDAATKTKNMLITTGAIAGETIDVAYLVRLYTEKAGPDDKDAKLVYGPVTVSKIAFSDGETKFTYDEMISKGVSSRMPSEPLLETLKALSTATNYDDLSPKERQAYFGKFLSLVDMMGKADLELRGLTVDAPNTASDEEGKKLKLVVDSTFLQMDGRKLNVGLHGLKMGNGDDKIEVAEASLTGFDWGSSLEGFGKFVSLEEDEMASFAFSQLMPELGTIRAAGINVDVTTPKTDDTAEGDEATAATVPERVQFQLKNYEMALTKPFNGIPTDITIKQEDLTLPIPENSSDETFVQLRKMGMEVLTVSYGLAANWDEANKNLVIKEISANGKDIGSINFSGLVSGFGEEFFSFDTTRMQGALFGLAGREVKMTIKDEGLIDKAVKLYAAQNDMTEDQVRGILTVGATMGLQEITATQPQLQGAADAVLRFINAPGTLTVTIKAKGPNGLGVLDLAAASQNPMYLLGRIDIEATAE